MILERHSSRVPNGGWPPGDASKIPKWRGESQLLNPKHSTWVPSEKRHLHLGALKKMSGEIRKAAGEEDKGQYLCVYLCVCSCVDSWAIAHPFQRCFWALWAKKLVPCF